MPLCTSLIEQPIQSLYHAQQYHLTLHPVFYLNYRRMSEIGRRRYTLNQFYAHANNLGCGDPSMKYEVQKFLLVTKDATDIHENFLTKSPSGLLNGLQAKRLRTGLAPFLMDSLVCVQLGNYHWSEECLGLTVGDLIFIKHSNRLRGAIRLCLPLNTIIEGNHSSSQSSSLPFPSPPLLSLTQFYHILYYSLLFSAFMSSHPTLSHTLSHTHSLSLFFSLFVSLSLSSSTVRSCNLSDVSIALPDCYPLIVSTFSRQYTILLRGEENRNKWVSVSEKKFLRMICSLRRFFVLIYPCLSLSSPTLLLFITSFNVFILLPFSTYHTDMSSHMHLQAILTANPCISSSSSSQYYTSSSNSSSGVTGQGQGQGQGNVGIAFGVDVQGRQLITSPSHVRIHVHMLKHTYILAHICTLILTNAHTCIHLHKHTLLHTCIIHYPIHLI